MIIVHQPLDRHADADLHAGPENHTFRLHLGDAPVDQRTVHLEVGNTVAHQSAGLGVLLIDMNMMAGAGELLRAGHARRT